MRKFFNWRDFHVIDKTDNGISFMTSYYEDESESYNEIGEEFDFDGQFLGTRSIERIQAPIDYIQNEYAYVTQYHELSLFSDRQKIAKMLGELFSNTEMDDVEHVNPISSTDSIVFVEFKYRGVAFCIVKTKSTAPKIQMVRFDSLGIGYVTIKHLFSDEAERHIIQKVISSSPKLRLKWLFN